MFFVNNIILMQPPDRTLPDPDDRPIRPKKGTYSIIEELEEEVDEEQVGEVVEKEVDMEKDTDAAGKPEKPDKNRPRSATKLEKERQNRLCRAQKQAERIKGVTKEEKGENVDNEVIEEKAEVEGMETKKAETRKIRKDSEGSSSQWETESEVVEEEEGRGEGSERVDEENKCSEEKDEEKEKEDEEEKNDEKEMREETKRLAAKIRSAGRRNRRKSSKGGR